MSQQSETDGNPFDAAKAIAEALKGLDKSSQALAFRFAGETLACNPHQSRLHPKPQ